MPKRYSVLRLATTAEQHDELVHNVQTLVKQATHDGDPGLASTLFALLDLMWNNKYTVDDRNEVIEIARRHSFSMTIAFEDAMDAEAAKNNPALSKQAVA